MSQALRSPRFRVSGYKAHTSTTQPDASPQVPRLYVPRSIPLRSPRRFVSISHPTPHIPPIPSRTYISHRIGIPSLWAGLSASILRQSIYSTARFGLYTALTQRARHLTGQERLSTSWTIACAGAAGGLAGLVGNPTEVVLVRMCADGAKPVAERFAYPNALVGLYRVGRDEGLGTFARGVSANVTRSVLMSELL